MNSPLAFVAQSVRIIAWFGFLVSWSLHALPNPTRHDSECNAAKRSHAQIAGEAREMVNAFPSGCEGETKLLVLGEPRTRKTILNLPPAIETYNGGWRHRQYAEYNRRVDDHACN